MKIRLIRTLAVLLPVVLAAFEVQAQNETCQFVGQISVESVKQGAFLVCRNTGNPAACSIASFAIVCAANPACDEVAKTFVENGCTYTVKKVGDFIKITGKALHENLDEVVKTWDYLNTAPGIMWLQKKLTGY